MYRSYRLQLRPTVRQSESLNSILALSCDLYNAALQERRDAWNLCRETVNLMMQMGELTELRAVDVEVRAVSVVIEREPLRRVDRAFKAFFRRCKAGEKPGFPRFKARSRYDSLTFPCRRLAVGALFVPRLGDVRFRPSRTIQGEPRTATVIRDGKKWFAVITCEIGPAPEKCAVSNPIGIDLGLTNFITLSDGRVVENPRWTRQHEARIARANRVLARKQRRSKNRTRARLALRRAHQRAADARRNFTHHVSKWLVTNFDLIAHEKLNIRGMVRSNLAKSILDAAWGELIWQTSYKAESAGRWDIPVNPKRTTIDCSGCGERVEKTLADRMHRCSRCGLILCRDHNAALNILRLGEALRGNALQNMRGCAPSMAPLVSRTA